MMVEIPTWSNGTGSKIQAFIVSGNYNVNLLWDFFSQDHSLSCQPMASALHSAICPHYPQAWKGASVGGRHCRDSLPRIRAHCLASAC